MQKSEETDDKVVIIWRQAEMAQMIFFRNYMFGIVKDVFICRQDDGNRYSRCYAFKKYLSFMLKYGVEQLG